MRSAVYVYATASRLSRVGPSTVFLSVSYQPHSHCAPAVRFVYPPPESSRLFMRKLLITNDACPDNTTAGSFIKDRQTPCHFHPPFSLLSSNTSRRTAAEKLWPNLVLGMEWLLDTHT